MFLFQQYFLKNVVHLLMIWGWITSVQALGQILPKPQIAFVSDTQAPMWEEKIFLKSNHNEKATGMIFRDILGIKPTNLFILGDVVSLGYKNKKWKAMDQYLDSCRKKGIQVSALLGNHDVMTNDKKGEAQFKKRFPDNVKTGYYIVTDSIAVVFLNSNFSKLAAWELEKQQAWMHGTMEAIDRDPGVLFAIVCCHHAPFTNSKIVGSNKQVQEYFIPDYIQSKKARLLITGHSHNYEHFIEQGKDFLVIGGGGGLSQPRHESGIGLRDLSGPYKPAFHYLLVTRIRYQVTFTSRFLKPDFSGFDNGLSFNLLTEKKP
jgi:Calcineurin-like phosphoesterase